MESVKLGSSRKAIKDKASSDKKHFSRYVNSPLTPTITDNSLAQSTMSLNVLLLVVLLSVGLDTAWSQDDDFVNDWDGEVNFECPEAQVIKSVYSVHENHFEDRRWKFDCVPPPSGAVPKNCEWTDDYVNDWDEAITFMCPPNQLLAGVYSVHNNDFEDRQMKFKCCKDSNYKTYSCELSDYLNEYDEVLDYNVPNGFVLTGWYSVHSNKREDRRHKMETCRYRAY
ncbi:hypothetical protein RRG08_006720 [Elysia crispata]|uniref:Dermatopontin n=1 Tax=Elysia crispata TaxID=231223 RepID=A0AAE1EEC9_9GAST|nr:hypothetical protein RRG08_006720 [Elysia crispata]